MTPKADTSLIEAQVRHEREWAIELWDGRYTYPQIRRIAALPPERGGLGYDLSESALKALVLAARTDRGDLAMSKADRVERQAAEVDSRARAARNDFDALRVKAVAIDEAIVALRESDLRHDDPIGYVNKLDRLVAKRAAISTELDRADIRLDRAQMREAKLFGLDAPTEAKLEVTTRDAVTDELNEMLARAGHKPVDVSGP